MRVVVTAITLCFWLGVPLLAQPHHIPNEWRDDDRLRRLVTVEHALIPLVDDYATPAAQLTPLQQERVQTGNARRIVASFDTQPLVGNIPALRFWNSLTVPQRERARRGERLTFASLSAGQQAIFQQAFQYRLLRMAEPPFAPEEQPTAYFVWQEEEREEFRAYGKYRYYSSHTLETLMETVQLNQREGEAPLRYVRALLRNVAFRFAAEQGIVQYQVTLTQEQSL